jgi:hypothetical protein
LVKILVETASRSSRSESFPCQLRARAMGSEHAGKTVTVAVLDVDLEEL